MSFREIGIPPDEFPQDVSGASKIIVLSQDQSQLYTRLGVLGVKTDGFLELANGLVELTRLRQRKTKIVMSLRQIRIQHDRLPEFLHPGFLGSISTALRKCASD